MNTDLLPAWNDPVHDAQTSFRCILKALSEPGSIQRIPAAAGGNAGGKLSSPAPLHAATTAALLTLADFETPLWLSDAARTPAVESYVRFHCACPLLDDPARAQFAVVTAFEPGFTLERFAQGSMEYPDRSATLLLQVPTLDEGPARILSGPGIAHTRVLKVGGLPPDFDAQWQKNGSLFPLGVDLIFCCGDALVGLPRTTRIHSEHLSCM